MGRLNGDAMVTMALNMAVAEAERNNPPGQFVDVVIDNAPGRLLDTLREADWMDRLASINPRVRLYPAWFAQLREMIVAQLPPDDEAAPA